MSSLSDSLLGLQLDEYQIVTPLGFGGMAHVYRALDTKLQRHVALKVIASGFRDDDAYRQRFAREAQSIARLEHPNIVHIYRLGEARGLYYIAMKYIEGADLRRLMDNYRINSQLIPLADTVRFVEEIGAALDYAHAQNVIHRDVKPGNIMIDQGGHAILTDFGLAFLSDVDQRDPVLGSPQYMAPEQAAYSDEVGPQSDLYSLGVTLFEMLTGALPFNGKDVLELIRSYQWEPRPPRDFNPALPSVFDEILLRCLEKDPRKRYQTGAELSAALRHGVDMWLADSLRVTQPVTQDPSRIDWTQQLRRMMTLSPMSDGPSPGDEFVLDTPPPSSTPETSEPTASGSLAPPPIRAGLARQSPPLFLDPARGLTPTPDGLTQVSLSSPSKPPERRPIWPYLVGLGVVGLLGGCLFALALAGIGGQRIQTAAIATDTSASAITPPGLTPAPTTLADAPSPFPTDVPVTPPLPTPTAVILLAPPSDKRDSVPPGSHRLGEFAVEWYCNNQGFGVELINNQTDWACTNANGTVHAVLGPADFDNICRITYKNPGAFAIRDQRKPIQAYNWSCYAYSDPSPANPSPMSLLPSAGQARAVRTGPQIVQSSDSAQHPSSANDWTCHGPHARGQKHSKAGC